MPENGTDQRMEYKISVIFLGIKKSLFVCLSPGVCLSACLSIHLLLSICPSVCLLLCVYLTVSLCISVHLSASLHLSLHVCLHFLRIWCQTCSWPRNRPGRRRRDCQHCTKSSAKSTWPTGWVQLVVCSDPWTVWTEDKSGLILALPLSLPTSLPPLFCF